MRGFLHGQIFKKDIGKIKKSPYKLKCIFKSTSIKGDFLINLLSFLSEELCYTKKLPFKGSHFYNCMNKCKFTIMFCYSKSLIASFSSLGREDSLIALAFSSRVEFLSVKVL